MILMTLTNVICLSRGIFVRFFVTKLPNSLMCCQFRNKYLLPFSVFQCDQQSSGTEAGGGDAHVFPEAHRQHRGHLLCLFHHLWNLGSAGERVREG